MRNLSKNMVLRFIMVACAMAQVAAVMPHHHHEASDTVCINPLHGLEAHGHTVAGEFSSHDPNPGCCSSKDVVTEDIYPCDLDVTCESVCNGHSCLHNTAGHSDSGECGFSHLDLNPPSKDKISFFPPVLDMLFASSITLDLLVCGSELSCCGHCKADAVVCDSAYGGTLTLYSSVCRAAIPPRAPSFLA